MFNPNIVIWCWEGKNSGKRRREIFSEYKEGRKTRKSISRVFEFASIEEEKKNFVSQLLKTKEYFSVLPIYQLEIENLEADDVIAYISNNLFKNDEKIIVSSDKDYFQLINDKIRVYRPIKKELITKEEVLKLTSVYPKNHALLKAFIGDVSDGVPKLKKGLGEKTLIKMFPFLKDDNIYTIEDVLKYSEEHKEDEKYQIFLTEESKKVIERNYDLVQLRDYNINSQSVEKIKSILITQKPMLSTSQLMIMFLKDHLQSQVKRMDSWRRLFLRLNWQFNKIENEENLG